MKLKLVSPWFTITADPEKATKPESCGTCAHGLVGSQLLVNSRDYVWCGVGLQREHKRATRCSVYRNIWKKL